MKKRVSLREFVWVEYRLSGHITEIVIITDNSAIYFWVFSEEAGPPTVKGYVITNEGSGSLEIDSVPSLISYITHSLKEDGDFINHPVLKRELWDPIVKMHEDRVNPEPMDEKVRAMTQLLDSPFMKPEDRSTIEAEIAKRKAELKEEK